MTYWTNGEWVGIGAGDHGRLNINQKRYSFQNIKNPTKWHEKCIKNQNGISKKSILTQQEIIEEFLIMGLRINKGINLENLQKNINCNSFYEILNVENINILSNFGLIEANNTNIKLTKKGFLLLNSVVEKLTPDF